MAKRYCLSLSKIDLVDIACVIAMFLIIDNGFDMTLLLVMVALSCAWSSGFHQGCQGHNASQSIVDMLMILACVFLFVAFNS